MLIGFAAGYGAMRADVQHLKQDTTATRVQVDRILDRLIWQESNATGPAPPVSK